LLHAGHDHHDHNLRSAYLHVLADALTSFLAIFALLSAKLFGLAWMDPLMGIVGAVLVTRWSWGLLRETSRVLLDYQAPAPLREAIRAAIESHADERVADLHVWSIGPAIYAAVVGLVTDAPKSAEFYKSLLPQDLGIVHVSVEVHPCSSPPGERRAA
jgi:cation diffusion facilitator family transporter